MALKLQQLIKYAYENAPGFKARMDKAGVLPSAIKTIPDLQKIPVLRKDDLIQLQKENPPFGGYLAVPQRGRSRLPVPKHCDLRGEYVRAGYRLISARARSL
jgi:phenylacetate-CoA ligase